MKLESRAGWWLALGVTTLCVGLNIAGWLWAAFLLLGWTGATVTGLFMAFVCFISLSDYWHRNDVGHA